MPSLQHIHRRIGSVKNTQKITKAMKLVSGAKLRRAQDRILAARPYAQKMAELIGGLGHRVDHEIHPLLARREEKRAEVVAISADRGLCGSFNANVIRTALDLIKGKQAAGIQASLTTVGRKSRDYFRKTPYNLRKSWVGLYDRLNFGHASEVARDIQGVFLAGDMDTCDLVYTEFQSVSSQKVVIQRLLPIGGLEAVPEDQDKVFGHYLYEPSDEEIFEYLLPRYVEVQLFRALLESAASEQGARMMAMDSATRNAQEMIGKLTRIYNKTRQAAITKELMDIIGGAEALK